MNKSRIINKMVPAVPALFILYLVPSGSLLAQPTDQVVEVRTVLGQDGVRPGQVFKAAAVLKVQPGYHINDNAPLDEFMFPTSLTIDDQAGFEVVEVYYPSGRRAKFSYSETELVVYEGEAVLGVLLRAKDSFPPGTVKLKGSLAYQACDNTSCLPPKEVAFEIAVPIVAAAAETKEANPDVFKKIPFKSLKK